MLRETTVKITQYCSVCKDELEMEVVPTGDGEEDGVLWLRCPRCHGFLPKISSGLEEATRQENAEPEVRESGEKAARSEPAPIVPANGGDGMDLDGGAAAASDTLPVSDGADTGEGLSTESADAGKDDSDLGEDQVTEFAAMLMAADLDRAVPYRPWDRYSVGDVIHHLAWDDCGVVVAKEAMPGNRQLVKVYFEKAGLVRLIAEDSM